MHEVPERAPGNPVPRLAAGSVPNHPLETGDSRQLFLHHNRRASPGTEPVCGHSLTDLPRGLPPGKFHPEPQSPSAKVRPLG